MACYYDSSIILSVILEEKGDFDPALIWDDVTIRLSSNLLKVECIVGIRKAGFLQNLSAEDEWVTHRVDLLEQYFNGIHFKMMDSSIEDMIRKNAKLAGCRSLDAIHLATALYFQTHLEEELQIASLDKRLRKVAAGFGFKLQPDY